MEKLKEALSTAPILLIPDPEISFELTTDVWNYAIGVILIQDQEGTQKFQAYESQMLNSAEQKYPTHEKKLLAIVHAIKTFYHYLYAKKFVVHTNNSPLTYLQT